MKWAILGLDLIAAEVYEKLTELHKPCVLACEKKKQLQVFQKQYPKAITYSSFEEVLLDPEIEIVYISTFLNEHAKQIQQALAYGKHVFCEKPMFETAKDAKAAYRLAKEKGVFLGEANTLFYMPLYQALSKAKLGKIKMIRAEFGSLKEENEESAIYQKAAGGGALYDIGIYALTAVLNFMEGAVKEVQWLQLLHPFGVDERWIILLTSEQQEIASIAISIRSKLEKRLLIAGENGYYEIENYPRANSASLIDPKGKKQQILLGDFMDAVSYELCQVEENIKANKDLTSTMKITIKVMEIMDLVKGEEK